MGNGHRGGRALRMLLCAGVLLWVYPAAGKEKPNGGKALYRQYCASCHGEDGKGAGPVAASLSAKPTDLTQLAKKAGGKFPYGPTMDAIDGTRLVRAHGPSNMPVWGERFERPAGAVAGMRAQVRGKLMQITEYLRSIQQQ
jgi:mono/diheme cytochrome c family protein